MSGDQRLIVSENVIGEDLFQQLDFAIELDELVLQGELLGAGGKDARTNIEVRNFFVELLTISDEILRVEIEPWEVPLLPSATTETREGGLYRSFEPGIPKPGDIHFTKIRGDDEAVDSWWQQTIEGNRMNQTITIQAIDKGTEVRQWIFQQCAIIAYSEMGSGLNRAAPSVAEETFTVRCQSLSFGLPAAGAPRFTFIQQLNDVTDKGEQLTQNLLVTEFDREGEATETRTFVDVVPVRYIFPLLDVRSDEPWLETIVYKPQQVQ